MLFDSSPDPTRRPGTDGAALLAEARALQTLSLRTLPNGARGFLVYVDGVPVTPRMAQGGCNAEARERKARRIPDGEAGRVRAAWTPAAPLADVALYLRGALGSA